MMSIFEWEASDSFDPATIVQQCIESGSNALLLDENAIPPHFFDLSSRVAGDLVHRVTLYEIPMALVVSKPSIHSAHFQDFAREANQGNRFRFFPTRPEAVAWLQMQVER